MSRFLLRVDDDLCSACGLCEGRAPENVEIPDGELVARVIRQPSGHDQTRACIEAVEYCPTGGLVGEPAPAGAD